MRKFIGGIDAVSKATGSCAKYVILLLSGSLIYDVFMRYVFNAPTIWAYDMTWMLYGVLSISGTAYCLQVDRHVRMDLFYTRLSPRGKAIAEMVCYIVIFFPAAYFVVGYCGIHAISSLIGRECTSASTWRPPVYPFKLVVALSLLLLAFQGIAIFLKDVYFVVKRRPYES